MKADTLDVPAFLSLMKSLFDSDYELRIMNYALLSVQPCVFVGWLGR